MTCREKLKLEHSDKVSDVCYAGCWGCPSNYGYLDKPDYCDHCYVEEACAACWDREIPEKPKHDRTYVMEV